MAGEDMGKREAWLVETSVGAAATTENRMEAPKKLKIDLPYDLAIPLLGVYPKSRKALI